jgi:hypothetical protein
VSAPQDNADEALRTSSICATLDYGHDRPNAEYFMTFPTNDAAMEYARSFLSAAARPAPTGISTDARLLRLVGEVYAGFQKVFPHETEGMTEPPRIVIVRSDEVNAFAGFDSRPEVNRGPWLFFVHDSILSKPYSDTELRGLFAHELGHLILRNTLPQTRAKIRVHYRIGKAGEHGVLGTRQDDDADARARVEEILALGDQVGRFPETRELPIGLFSTTKYEAAYAVFAPLTPTSPNPDACTQAKTLMAGMDPFLRPHISNDTFAILLSDAEKAELAARTRAVSDALSQCYAHAKMSLLELKVRATVSMPPADLDALVAKVLDPTTPEHAEAVSKLLADPDERRLDETRGDTNTAALMSLAVSTLHEKLGKLGDAVDLPIDSIRVFDFEEDADDASVRVLRAISDDPTGNAQFLDTLLKDSAACKAMIAAGSVPQYGRFVDPHNATCYRRYHIEELARALDEGRCGESTYKAPAKGTGVVLPSDKSPDQLLEKGHGRY